MNKSVSAAFLAIGSFICSFFFLGFFYDYYEAYASALVTGKITPSIEFDTWFYFGYIGFVKVFVLLYQLNENIDWYSVISYSLLVSALLFYIKAIDLKFYFLKLAILLMVLVFFSEHFMLLNMNRVSFLLSFIALFHLFIVQKHPSRKQILMSYVGFTLAFLFRMESAILSFIIVGFTMLAFCPPLSNLLSFKRSAVLLVYPILLIASFSLWFDLDIKKSTEFYKQIEPDVEYQLMTRDNIVDISNMSTAKDSIRYEAVFNGVWGDAKTNDAHFLRSLIGDDLNSLISMAVINRGFHILKATSMHLGMLPWVNVFVFLILCVVALMKSKGILFNYLQYQLLFVALLVFISGYVKMTEPALSSLLFINLFTLLYFGHQLFSKKGKLMIYAFGIVLVCMACIKAVEMKKLAKINLANVEESNQKLTLITKVAQGKKLYLSGESLTPIFNSFQPFKPYSNEWFNGLYVFNSLAMSTISPYKEYLDLECQCQATDYASFFPAIKKEGDLAVFLMAEDTKNFYERYLSTVHQLDINFDAIVVDEMEADNEYSAGLDKQKTIRFYAITP